MKIHLDVCCVSRLTDDQTQHRIRREAEAVQRTLERVRIGKVQWMCSEALIDEVDRNPDVERKFANAALLALASERLVVDDSVIRRAEHLQRSGYKLYDALHLACAEAAQVDVLLTTDDDFVRRASRGGGSAARSRAQSVILEQELPR